MPTTGRSVRGPAVELVEVQADNGLKHVALVHNPAHADHPLLRSELQAVLGFMERPGVPGIAPLVDHEPETGTFVYPTGTVWTVAEVVHTFAQEGDQAGVKAGIELCYLVAEVLGEAATAGSPHQIFCHGNLNPWNVVLKGDGQPLILGYALPQVELEAWRRDGADKPAEDSFRYVPPERLEGAPEDLSSDLFTLALISLELMMGRPVYDGLVEDIRQQAARGEGMRRLYQWREHLPQNVREVLGRALKPDADTRYPTGLDFVHELHELLGSVDVEGPNLVEVMATVQAMQKRGKVVVGGHTAMLTEEERNALAADLQDFEDRKLPPPKKPRPPGSGPAREGAAVPDVGTSGEAAGPEADRPRWERAKRSSPQEPAPSNEGASARERLKRRVRREAAEAAPPPPPVAPEPASETPVPRPMRVSEPVEVAKTPRAGGPVTRRVIAPPARPAPPDRPPQSGRSPDREARRERLRKRLQTRDIDAAEVAAARAQPSPSDVDLDGPDDVELAEAVEPDEESSPAAALLRKLRSGSSGSRRRRVAPPSRPATPEPAPGRRAAPDPEVPVEAPPDRREAPPDRREAPPDRREAPPDRREALKVAPPRRVDRQRGGAAAASGAHVTVGHDGRQVQIPVVEGDRAATVALRAAVALGAMPVDPTGRLRGGIGLVQGRKRVPGAQVVATLGGSPLELQIRSAETRLVDVEVRTEPSVRLRTPLLLSLPASWLAMALQDWLELPAGRWIVTVGDDGAHVHADVSLGEALGDGTRITLIRG